jgi:hypothetical protein
VLSARHICFLSVASLVGVAATARADFQISAPRETASIPITACAPATEPITPANQFLGILEAPTIADPLTGASQNMTGVLNETAAQDEVGATLELPPLPGSASLFLSALVSMGAWHLVRSVKHVRLESLPEWYHAGGPSQIGHAVPFDLGFSLTPVAFGSFQPPNCDRIRLYHRHREQRARCEDQFFFTSEDSRAPPSLSF